MTPRSAASQRVFAEASGTFPSWFKPLLPSDSGPGGCSGGRRGRGGGGRRPSLRVVPADRPRSPSVSATARSDWRREGKPQVFSVHRGAGRREGDQSSSVSMKSPQHSNETATSFPLKANEFDLFGL